MDGESRKRKMDKEEEEDEEEKMQKFYALIRSTRDLRERIMGGADKSKEEEKKKGQGEKAVDVWKPAFLPEDFREGAEQHSKIPQASMAGPSKKQDEAKEDDKGEGGDNEGLDLNLSL